MNFRKKMFLTAVTLFALVTNSAIKASAEEFPKDKPFTISPVENQELVVDAFGDELPKVKTYAHLYSKAAAYNTAQIKALYQPQHNNSFELHMQQDQGLCFGPDVGGPNQMYEGVKAIVKRDCQNTLNHLMEGEQLRVNKTNYCLQARNSNLKQLERLVYATCNGSNGQRFKLNFGKPEKEKSYNYSCFRKANSFVPIPFVKKEYPCYFNLPGSSKTIVWTGGSKATVIFRQKDIQDEGRTSRLGGYSHRYLNDDEGEISIPEGTVKIDIAPWDEKGTTYFTVVTVK